jgi:hypothetical protein
MADLAAKLRPVARAMLAPDETLAGCCVATWQKTLSGRMVAIAVAPTRIVVQPLDRRFSPTGAAIPLPPDALARVRVANGVGGSVSIPSLIVDAVSITVDLSPVTGERMRLLLMGAGGRIQHDGIRALLAYLQPLVEPNS